jgi:hypothetical protein
MHTARAGRACQLADGRVIVVGGFTDELVEFEARLSEGGARILPQPHPVSYGESPETTNDRAY